MRPSRRSAQLATPDRLKKATLALEDMLFAFRQARMDSLEVAIEALNDLVAERSGSASPSAVARSYQSPDPNKHFLIGALPRLLLDRDLFPSNEDIVEFATAALRIDMKVEKRARFEIIGKIVCETDTLDEQQLTGLVKALERLVDDKHRIAVMVERKKTGSFSWNETLQELLQN
jgi:hypothetical protein